MMKFSILIAVYNAERYLPACLDSLRRQTLTEWEAICVDDASTDRSWDVLQQYANMDSRIKTVRLEENHGQGHARNVGLQQAAGQWVAFLDSDDWLADDALERVAAVFTRYPKTGSVLFRLLYNYDDGREEPYPMQDFTVLSGKDAFRLSLTWAIHGVYVVRRDIHFRYPYDESAHSFSDDNTTRLHYLASDKVRCSDGVYHYRQHSASVSHAASVYRFDYLSANASMKRQMISMAVEDSLISLYENVRWLNVIDVYQFYFKYRSNLSTSDRKHGLACIKQAWQSIEVPRLRLCTRLKFGYIPFRCCWQLFRLEEETYFSLRRLLGR